MQDDVTNSIHSDTTLAKWLAEFLTAMLEVFRSDREGDAYAQHVRQETERYQAAEAAIKTKYNGAWFKRDQLLRRAAAHGVTFTLSATYEHQAAILDFLDRPHAPTPLTWGHTTWFYAIDAAGRPTASRTHPVNRAKFIWNVIDLNGKQATGIVSIDEPIARLRTNFPADRLAWTDNQWSAFEGGRVGGKPVGTNQASAIRPTESGVRTGLSHVPLRP